MLSLPSELYRLIFRSVTGSARSKRSLLSLMLTCQAFKAEAERELYHEYVHTGDSLETQSLFLHAVAHSPSKASLVRVYMCQLGIIDTQVFLPLLREFLRFALNLKQLRFIKTDFWTPCTRVLKGCAFELDALAWHAHREEENLLSFLAKQPALRTLCAGEWRPGYAAPAGIVPHLNTLTGDHGLMYNFLPGRRITHIFWRSRFFDGTVEFERDFPFECLRRVQVLRYENVFSHRPLSAIADYLSNLVTLELVLTTVRGALVFHKIGQRSDGGYSSPASWSTFPKCGGWRP